MQLCWTKRCLKNGSDPKKIPYYSDGKRGNHLEKIYDTLGSLGSLADGKTNCICSTCPQKTFIASSLHFFWWLYAQSFPGKPHQPWAWCHYPHPGGFQLLRSPENRHEIGMILFETVESDVGIRVGCRLQAPMMVQFQNIPSGIFDITGLVV